MFEQSLTNTHGQQEMRPVLPEAAQAAFKLADYKRAAAKELLRCQMKC